MSVDIERLFDDYDIPYITEGNNVKSGNINVACPYCGDDPSEHLGISLEYPYPFACWRNSNHKGTLPHLLTKLLRISYQQAKELVGERNSPVLDSFSDQISDLFSKNEQEKKMNVEMPEEFRSLNDGRHSSKRFIRYLESRGFIEIDHMVDFYNLRYVISGNYNDRIIIPVYDDKGNLVSWTGRSIHANAEPKYKSAKYTDEEKEAYNIKDYIFNPPELNLIDRILVVTEGPLDALKVDWFSVLKNNGVRGTCIFGATCTDEQSAWLTYYSKLFERIIIMLDSDLTGQINGRNIMSSLVAKCLVSCYSGLSEGQDPGDLSWNEYKTVFGGH